MSKIKVLYLSSMPLTNTTGGSVVMYNHLVNETFTVYALDENVLNKHFFSAKPLVSLEMRLQNSRLYYWVQAVRHLSIRRLLTGKQLKQIVEFAPDVVVTVAHGELFWLAIKVAKKLNLPLVSVFHDWWPEICDREKNYPFFYRQVVNTRFKKLHEQSDCSICITDEMKQELGPNKKSVVLLPCTDFSDVPIEKRQLLTSFKVIYAGNIMASYGVKLRSLMNAFPMPSMQLSIIGNAWDWPQEKIEEGRDKNVLYPSMYGNEFKEALATASAFLVVLDFDKAFETWTRTLFPSKISSYAKFGKPIILWGPANASGAQFLLQNDLGIVVSDPDPAALISQIQKLQASPEMQNHYSQQARFINQSLLNPVVIQQQFVDVLESVAKA